MRDLPACLQIVKVSFMEQVAFRVNTVMIVIAYPIIVFANYFLFGSLYDHSEEIAGYAFPEIFTYISVVWFVRTFYAARIERIIGSKIRNGDISLDLLRPLRISAIYFSLAVGKVAHRILFITLPVALICLLLEPLLPPAGLVSFLFFLWSVLCGFLYTFLIGYAVGISCFHLGYHIDLTWTVELVIGLLSGLVVPLRFFPQWLETIVLLLPFHHLYYTPAQAYIGEIPPSDFGAVFLSQMFGLLILFAVAKAVEITGFRKLVIQGG